MKIPVKPFRTKVVAVGTSLTSSASANLLIAQNILLADSSELAQYGDIFQEFRVHKARVTLMPVYPHGGAGYGIFALSAEWRETTVTPTDPSSLDSFVESQDAPKAIKPYGSFSVNRKFIDDDFHNLYDEIAGNSVFTNLVVSVAGNYTPVSTVMFYVIVEYDVTFR